MKCTFVGPDNERALRAVFQPTVPVNQVGHVFCYGQGRGAHRQRLEGWRDKIFNLCRTISKASHFYLNEKGPEHIYNVWNKKCPETDATKVSKKSLHPPKKEFQHLHPLKTTTFHWYFGFCTLNKCYANWPLEVASYHHTDMKEVSVLSSNSKRVSPKFWTIPLGSLGLPVGLPLCVQWAEPDRHCPQSRRCCAPERTWPNTRAAKETKMQKVKIKQEV